MEEYMFEREGWKERIKAWEDGEGCSSEDDEECSSEDEECSSKDDEECSSEYCSDERMQWWRGDWFSVTEIRLTHYEIEWCALVRGKMSFMECMELEF